MQIQIFAPGQQAQQQPKDLEQPIRLRMILKNNINIQEINSVQIIENLSAILEKYITWDDVLSYRIQEWGEKVLMPLESDDENLALKKIEERAFELFSKVLYSHFLSPLKHPILDGKWTWEKTELQSYCEKYKNELRSPFGSCGPMNFEAMKVHAFAVDIITWAQELPIEPSQPLMTAPLRINQPLPQETKAILAQIEDAPVEQQDEPQEKPAKALVNRKEVKKVQKDIKKQKKEYLQLGKMANSQLVSYQFCAVVKADTKELAATRAELEEYVRLKKQAFEVELREEFAAMHDKIDHNDDLNKEAISIMQERLCLQDKELRDGFVKLTATAQRLALAEARERNLAYQLQDAQSRIHSRNNSGGGCTLL